MDGTMLTWQEYEDMKRIEYSYETLKDWANNVMTNIPLGERENEINAKLQDMLLAKSHLEQRQRDTAFIDDLITHVYDFMNDTEREIEELCNGEEEVMDDDNMELDRFKKRQREEVLDDIDNDEAVRMAPAGLLTWLKASKTKEN